MLDDHRQDYRAYMLRLWRVEGGDRPMWRASVESPHTGERQAFADLKALFAFLEEKTVLADESTRSL
jgi:hypothetical protein